MKPLPDHLFDDAARPEALPERRRKELAMLGRSRRRAETGLYLIEGVRAVEAAVLAGAPIVELVVTEAALAQPRVQALAARAGAPTFEAYPRHLAQISAVEAAQGVLAVAEIRLLPPEGLAARRAVVLLDGVQDPGNVGALLRTCAWFGVEAVAGGPSTADFFNPKVVRASMGGLWDLDVAQTPDLAATAAALSEAGFAVYGADLEGAPSHTWAPAEPFALVLGSEAHGISEAVAARLTGRVAIPGSRARRSTESLNVATAGAMLLYEWRRGG